MEYTIINDPRAGFLILITLSLADLVLRNRIEIWTAGREEFFEYETVPRRDIGSLASFALILLKISPPFLIAILWAAARASGSQALTVLYAGILGFAVSFYLIVNMNHLESLLTGALTRRYRNSLSGRISVKRRFSLMQYTIRIFVIFVFLCFIAILRPTPFYIGMALAPVALIARNILLTK
jgi:hypothetical protein